MKIIATESQPKRYKMLRKLKNDKGKTEKIPFFQKYFVKGMSVK